MRCIGFCHGQVVAYFAPQFAELRERILAGGHLAFVVCLARCARWASRGGKSNARFFKTRDDRLVLKQLSKAERASVRFRGQGGK